MEYEHLRQQLGALPSRPGVYLLKGKEDDILYVGKAGSLRHRVGSYFGSSRDLSPKLQGMVYQIADLEFFVTDSEQEAILLECNLIKRYRPRYNVRLKDDKSYPYLKVGLGESWPGVYLTRRLEKDGARYFGPFASAGSVRRTLTLLKKLFLVRTCRRTITGSEPRPCLDYHVRRCLGPCISAVSKEEYRQAVDQVVLFLEGKQEVIVGELYSKMRMAAENLEFERAALIRDQIRAVEDVIEKQKVAAAEGEMDVIAFAQARNQACVLLFLIRNGKLLGREQFLLAGTEQEVPSEIITSFVKQFYSSATYIPERILLQHELKEISLVKEWLEGRRGARVDLRVPRRGVKKDLVDMVAENARHELELRRVKLLADADALATALEELRESLSLPCLPRRVECYDISNIGGVHAVGSMVVFEGGQPQKSHYRRFRIRSVEGANDCAMIREVLRRRFRRRSNESQESAWAMVPDLVVIDGGRGQLSAALEVMEEAGVQSISCISIAKENEAIFLPQLVDPVMLRRDSAALYFVQRIRDEAHRFAVGYYRRVHHGDAFVSSLDAIPGVGASRKRSLLRRFGSIGRIRGASVEDLMSVKGITRSVAERIKDHI